MDNVSKDGDAQFKDCVNSEFADTRSFVLTFICLSLGKGEGNFSFTSDGKIRTCQKKKKSIVKMVYNHVIDIKKLEIRTWTM